jgi:Holliday junction resolvase RusA-like endonuclease
VKTLVVTYLGQVTGENRRLAVGRGRMYRQGRYSAFVRALATMAMAEAGGFSFSPLSRLSLSIKGCIPRRMDIDNLIKPCQDAMQLAGVIPDDNQVDLVMAERRGVAAPLECSLLISVMVRGK